MDNQQFDHWTRLFAEGSSRRYAASAAIALITSVLIPLGPPGASAGCLRIGAKCTRGDRCCGAARCRRGRCRYATGTIKINGGCFTQGICPPAAIACGLQCANAPSSGDYANCFCGTTTEGPSTCFRNARLCGRQCQSDTDCRLGRACFITSDYGGGSGVPGTCLQPCPSEFMS